MKFLNTFEGLTNIEKCSHEGKIRPIDAQHESNKYRLPFMVLILENHKIAEDSYSLLLYYVLHYALVNQSEKEKLKNCLTSILSGIFNLTYYNIEYNESTMNEKQFIESCTKI